DDPPGADQRQRPALLQPGAAPGLARRGRLQRAGRAPGWLVAVSARALRVSAARRPGVSAPTLSVVIPAYNEERVIGATAEQVLQYLEPRGGELLVVDDGSRDRTVEVVAGLLRG